MRIIPRAEWGAKHGRGSAGAFRRGEVIVHTEAADAPASQWTNAPVEREAARLRGIEDFHVRVRKWSGFAYSFAIFPSGRCYEGRGWGRNGSHTQKGRNESGYGVVFIGHGDHEEATPAAWATARELIAQGIRIGAITPSYVVSGHRDYTAKSCPGNRNYPHLSRLRGVTGSTSGGPFMALSDAEQQELLNKVRAITTAIHGDPGEEGVAVRVQYLRDELLPKGRTPWWKAMERLVGK